MSEPSATNPSRKERREERRRLHEAQKKAKAIEKANDKKIKRAYAQEMWSGINMDKAQKKTNKGKTDKAQKKVDKGGGRRNGGG